MEIKNILIVLSILVVSFACEKEDSANPLKTEKSSLRYSKVKPKDDQVNTIPFQILYGGVYEENLYMAVSYVGGEFGHEFTVNWDGNVIADDDKKIVKLNIYHLTDDDNGTDQMQDSLFLSLSELNIPEDLMDDEALWYDIVNSSDENDHILFQVNPIIIPDENEEPKENIEMIVVKSSCDEYGVWNGLWLKNLENNSDEYYLPLDISESIDYTPVENDILKISFEYTYFTDSTTKVNCDFWYEHNVTVIKVADLEKIIE
jgi:hypothetical protein